MIWDLVRSSETTRAALSTAGHQAATRAAQRALQISDPRGEHHTIAIEKDVLGKPEARVLGSAQSVAVSISHAAPFVCAVADTAPVLLGTDIERIRPCTTAVWEACLTPAEKAFIAAAPRREREMLQIRAWSLKEAVLKAFGVGLRVHPRNVDVTNALGATTSTVRIGWRGVWHTATVEWMHLNPTYVAVAVAFPFSARTLE
ncbi:MAG: 4'-phosphopantetheinyl transferase superfamily protein [Patescibacteria group bacterium]